MSKCLHFFLQFSHFPGESLVPASDVSYLAPLVPAPPTLPLLELNTSQGPSTSGISQQNPQQSSSSFFHDDDEDQDETKNFRDEEIESPRCHGSTSTLKNDEEAAELSDFLSKSNLTTLEEVSFGGNLKFSA